MFLDEILAELKAMTGDGCHEDADELLLNVIRFCSGWIRKDYPDMTAKLTEIVATYKQIPRDHE